MEGMPAYQYQALEAEGAIRLITLHPSPDLLAPVQCSMIHTTLLEYEMDTIDHYSALSYVWGDSGETALIQLDNHDFRVTINLESALRHIRDATRSRKLWADAICINQLDNAEKSVQVKQMWEVYKTAHHTLIYLGDATHYSDSFMRIIQKKGHISTLEDELNSSQVADIFGRVWFTRVWVLQELVFSVDPWIHCGRSSVRWETLSKNFLSKQDLVPSDLYHLFKNMFLARKQWNFWERAQKIW